LKRVEEVLKLYFRRETKEKNTPMLFIAGELDGELIKDLFGI
jgi:hypothetical protein